MGALQELNKTAEVRVMHQMFGQCENAVLQGMARCEDMRAPIITEQHQNTSRGKAEQLIKQGSDLILKQATDCCTQTNLVYNYGFLMISAPYCGLGGVGWWRGLS